MFDEDEMAMDEIAATLAHEVKNPVSLIRANIDYLELVGGTTTYQKNFKVIKRELDKISNVVGDFIEFAKPLNIEDAEEINMLQLIAEVIDDLTAANDGAIEFIINGAGNIHSLTVSGSRAQLSSLFLNIYKNAVEALKGVDKPAIKTKMGEACGNVVVTVSDNGAGIEQDVMERIGSPFITTKEGGSGLGLSICKNIVKRHKGGISIGNNSEDDEGGCVVTITLPLC